jgi:glycosyltransferase involved in cell wall biosynthesis
MSIVVGLRLGSHPVYQDLVLYPPKGIRYKVIRITTAEGPKIFQKIKEFIWRTYTKFYPPILNLGFRDFDLVHSNGVMLKTELPWVIDVESVGSLVNHNYENLLNKDYTQKIINTLSSPSCKKIIIHTKSGMYSIIYNLDTNHFKEKLEVVYPAIRSANFRKKKNTDRITLLFIGRRFYEKGGLEVLQTFTALEKKFDVKLLVVANVPNHLKKKVKDNVEFYLPNMPRNFLFQKIYPRADIFIFPTYIDAMPTVVMEAFSFGLPVIGTKSFSMPELVENNKNGFLVDTPISYYDKKFLFRWKDLPHLNQIVRKDKPKIVKALVEKTSLLIHNSALRKKMSKEAKKEVVKGKFSIKTRNKKLKQIYEEALKK